MNIYLHLPPLMFNPAWTFQRFNQLFSQKKEDVTFIKSRPQPAIIRVTIPFIVVVTSVPYLFSTISAPSSPHNETARSGYGLILSLLGLAAGNGLERQPRITRFQDLTPHRQRPRDRPQLPTDDFPQGVERVILGQ